ncbi:MAG: choice-of-anchor J domain-containing protein [Chitinophagaceae bacterium]
MKRNQLFLIGATLTTILVIALACVKDPVATKAITPLPTTSSASFVEEFDSVGNLSTKGWVIRNNSFPVGQSSWRQGRFEAMPLSTPATKKGGFLGPVPYLGFQAHSVNKSPQDFISCDITALGDLDGNGGTLSAWLISPQVPMKNGDQIIFHTRAINDDNYPVATKDRMQVMLNRKTGTADVGLTASSRGSFDTTLLDINPGYSTNDPSGYPRAWRKYTLTIGGLPAAGITNGRFAFRYYGVDAGFFGGSSGNNYPSLIGIDSLAFVRK